MTTLITQTKDLWAIAIAKVGDDDRAQLDIPCMDKVAVLDNILSLVKGKNRSSACRNAGTSRKAPVNR